MWLWNFSTSKVSSFKFKKHSWYTCNTWFWQIEQRGLYRTTLLPSLLNLLSTGQCFATLCYQSLGNHQPNQLRLKSLNSIFSQLGVFKIFFQALIMFLLSSSLKMKGSVCFELCTWTVFNEQCRFYFRTTFYRLTQPVITQTSPISRPSFPNKTSKHWKFVSNELISDLQKHWLERPFLVSSHRFALRHRRLTMLWHLSLCVWSSLNGSKQKH